MGSVFHLGITSYYKNDDQMIWTINHLSKKLVYNQLINSIIHICTRLFPSWSYYVWHSSQKIEILKNLLTLLSLLSPLDSSMVEHLLSPTSSSLHKSRLWSHCRYYNLPFSSGCKYITLHSVNKTRQHQVYTNKQTNRERDRQNSQGLNLTF